MLVCRGRRHTRAIVRVLLGQPDLLRLNQAWAVVGLGWAEAKMISADISFLARD